MRFGKAFGARSRDADRAVRPGRPDPHLLEPAVAQFLASAIAIGKGERSAPATSSPKAPSRPSVLVDMAIEKGIDMPVAAAVAAVLDDTLGVDAAIEALLTRPLRAE